MLLSLWTVTCADTPNSYSELMGPLQDPCFLQQHDAATKQSLALDFLWMAIAHLLAVKVGQPARNVQQDAVPSAVPAQAPRGACAVLPGVARQRVVQIAAFHVLRGRRLDLVGPRQSYMTLVTACRNISQVVQGPGAGFRHRKGYSAGSNRSTRLL